MINRLEEPSLKLASKIELVNPEKIKLANGIDAYIISAGDQEIIKLELVFKAGEWAGDKAIFATAVNELMDEGTGKRTAFEISQAFDYYGAYLQTECSLDRASVKLYTLTRFAKETFQLLLEVLTEAVFPENEIATYREQNIQQLKVSRQKVDYLARKEFNKLLFSENHPYGRVVGEQNYADLKTDSLKSKYMEWYNPSNCFVLLSGKVKKQTVEDLKDVFGKWVYSNTKVEEINHPTGIGFSPVKKLIEKEGAVQSAIRIGKVLFNKTHPDFVPLTVLTTILGGYFGSRLMSNIREDKGYTYGIGSSLISLEHAGYLVISTQVGNDVRHAALKEIYFEINRLINEPVMEEELSLVKSYLTGSFQRSIDGSLSWADRVKSLLSYDLDVSFYENYLQQIQTSNPVQLQNLAAKYLQTDSMIEVVSG